MQDQLDLFPLASPGRITVSEGFDLLWKYHMAGKPSAKQFNSNRKALCLSIGNRYLDTLTPFDVRRHKQNRLQGTGPFIQPVGTWAVFHDHTLIALLYNKLVEWKRDRIKMDGIDFGLFILPPINPTIGIKKKKGGMRKRIALPNEFAKLMEHADHDLADLITALLLTAARLNDALLWKPENYNAYTDQIEWQQHKTGKWNCVPANRKLRAIFSKANKEKREFVFSARNLRERYAKLLKKCGITNLHLGRDFRKTMYNVARRKVHNPDIPRMILGHSSIRTGEEHYYIEERGELRPVINFVAKTYVKKNC